jgi:hypothetical protein
MALDEFTSKELIVRVPEISGQVRAPAVLPLSDVPPLCFFAEFLKFIGTSPILAASTPGMRPTGKGRGKVTQEKLGKLGIKTVAELRRLEVSALEDEFGRYGVRLYELAGGIDDNPVVSDRPTQSISVEDTFEHDMPLLETEPTIRRLAEKLWSASRKESRLARTVVLKLKTSEFKILT